MAWTTTQTGLVLVDGAAPQLGPKARAEYIARVLTPWGPLAREWGAKLGVLPARILAFIWAESRGNKDARSPAGARGLMQLLSSAWTEGLGEAQIFEPSTNVRLGTQALAKLAKVDPDLPSVASRYNAGQVPSTQAPHPGPPPWGYKAGPGYIDQIVAANNSAIIEEQNTNTPVDRTPEAPILIGALVVLAFVAWMTKP